MEMSRLEPLTKWDSLRFVGQSKLVGLSILVPVFGYMILFNQNLLEYYTLITDVNDPLNRVIDEAQISEAVTARLYFLYYGFTFVGLGSLLYFTNCHRLIKLYRNLPEFIAAEINTSPQRAGNIADMLLQESTRWPASRRILDGMNLPNEQLEFISKRYSQELDDQKMIAKEVALRKQLMTAEWAIRNDQKPRLRITISALYVIGFLLLAVPSVELFIKITNRAFFL